MTIFILRITGGHPSKAKSVNALSAKSERERGEGERGGERERRKEGGGLWEGWLGKRGERGEERC